jgi:hypothetical protein
MYTNDLIPAIIPLAAELASIAQLHPHGPFLHERSFQPCEELVYQVVKSYRFRWHFDEYTLLLAIVGDFLCLHQLGFPLMWGLTFDSVSFIAPLNCILTKFSPRYD